MAYRGHGMSRMGQSRAVREGWTGRRRNYKCRVCGEKFQHDGSQLPVKARICLECRQDPEHKATFEKAMDERVTA